MSEDEDFGELGEVDSEDDWVEDEEKVESLETDDDSLDDSGEEEEGECAGVSGLKSMKAADDKKELFREEQQMEWDRQDEELQRDQAAIAQQEQLQDEEDRGREQQRETDEEEYQRSLRQMVQED